jgi:archaellum component FlaG (FlaF/FlaG flagellin family)
MQVKGTIKRIEATNVVSDKFSKRDVVVTTDGEYPQDLNIQFTQNKCDVLNNYTAGDNVVIDINLKGNDRVNSDGVVSNFTKIEGWKISKSEIY